MHAGAAPLVAKEGAKFYDRFVDSLLRIIRPRKQLTPFQKIAQIAAQQEAERQASQRAA